MPLTKTIQSELSKSVLTFFGTARMYNEADELLLDFEEQARKLSKADVREGYLMRAAASAFTGNIGTMRSRYQIAENQGLSGIQKLNYATVLAHVGLFSDARKLVESVGTNCDSLSFAATRALMSLSLQMTDTLFSKAIDMKIELSDEDIRTALEISHVAETMRNSDVSDVLLAEIADMAGQVMRDHRVFYFGSPDFFLFPADDGKDNLCTTFHVPVSFDEATDMNFELAEMVVSKDLPPSASRLTFRFMGQDECHA